MTKHELLRALQHLSDDAKIMIEAYPPDSEPPLLGVGYQTGSVETMTDVEDIGTGEICDQCILTPDITPPVSAERLRELVDYDPETGALTKKATRQ